MPRINILIYINLKILQWWESRTVELCILSCWTRTYTWSGMRMPGTWDMVADPAGPPKSEWRSWRSKLVEGIRAGMCTKSLRNIDQRHKCMLFGQVERVEDVNSISRLARRRVWTTQSDRTTYGCTFEPSRGSYDKPKVDSWSACSWDTIGTFGLP